MTIVSDPTPGDCGKVTGYKVKFAVTAGTPNGTIVQHMVRKYDVKRCDGTKKDVYAPSDYYEGWEVRDGIVYHGASNQPHVADEFGFALEYETYGTKENLATVSFLPNYRLRQGNPYVEDEWSTKTISESRGVPVTHRAPTGWGSVPSKPHTLKVKWNCCPETLTHTWGGCGFMWAKWETFEIKSRKTEIISHDP